MESTIYFFSCKFRSYQPHTDKGANMEWLEDNGYSHYPEFMNKERMESLIKNAPPKFKILDSIGCSILNLGG